MCLAVPSKIISINNTMAIVDVYGARRDVSLLLIDDVNVGDYVLVHAGFAIQKIQEDIAEESLDIIKQVFEKSTE